MSFVSFRCSVLWGWVTVFSLVALDCANAEVGRWSAHVEDDPFDNKGKLMLNFQESWTSGLLVLCEEDEGAIVVRRASPYPYDQSSPPAETIPMGVIVDKGRRYGGLAVSQFLATGNIGFDLKLPNEDGRQFLNDLAAAKSKIYVKVGESDPDQFGSKGSTRAAQKALEYCY